MLKQVLALSFILFCAACATRESHQVVVTGRIEAAVKGLPVSVAVNRIGFGQETKEAWVDSAGRFRLEFNSDVPTDVWLIYQSNFLFTVNPGDSLHIEFDGSKEDRVEILASVRFKGDRSALNDEIAAFQKSYYQSALYLDRERQERAVKAYGPDQFILFADSLKSEGLKLYNDFVKAHRPSTGFEDWARLFVREDYLFALAFYPDEHRKALVLKQSDWSVTPSYYDFLLADQPGPGDLRSGHSFFLFTDKYVYRYIRTKTNARLGLPQGIVHERPRGYDSIFLRDIVTLTPNKFLRAAAITEYVNNSLDAFDFSVYESNKDLILTNVTEPFLLDPLKKKYEEMQRKDKLPAAHDDLPTTEALSSTLIQNVAKEFKGKVIYLDTWATWCGPCREEFPYSKKLKEEFNDVVFVYVCVDSDEKAYRRVINTYQIDGVHYFLNGAESKQFRTQLNINGIPHYMLFDQNGALVPGSANLKPSEDITRSKIAQLLGKTRS